MFYVLCIIAIEIKNTEIQSAEEIEKTILSGNIHVFDKYFLCFFFLIKQPVSKTWIPLSSISIVDSSGKCLWCRMCYLNWESNCVRYKGWKSALFSTSKLVCLQAEQIFTWITICYLNYYHTSNKIWIASDILTLTF